MNGCGVGHDSEVKQAFYAAFISSSYIVPGDERSRTNPGHGYPEHTVEYTDVKEFKTEEELKEWIEKTTITKYRVVKCFPMEVTKTISVNVVVK